MYLVHVVDDQDRIVVESLQRISGTLTSEPRLSISPVGRCRFDATFEVPSPRAGRHAAARARRSATLIVIGPLAERAYAQFTEGDRFLAAGSWSLSLPALGEQGEARFFARQLGHDLAQHRYAVDRTRRRGWEPHAHAHLLTADWAAPLLDAPGDKGSVAS